MAMRPLIVVLVAATSAAASATSSSAAKPTGFLCNATHENCHDPYVPAHTSVTKRTRAGCDFPADFLAGTASDHRVDAVATLPVTRKSHFTLRSTAAYYGSEQAAPDMRVDVYKNRRRVKFINRSPYAVRVRFTYNCHLRG